MNMNNLFKVIFSGPATILLALLLLLTIGLIIFTDVFDFV